MEKGSIGYSLLDESRVFRTKAVAAATITIGKRGNFGDNSQLQRQQTKILFLGKLNN